MPKPYYSERINGIRRVFTLEDLKMCFLEIIDYYLDEGYLIEAFGYRCVDGNDYPGILRAYGEANKINLKIKMETGLENIWPLENTVNALSEEELYSIIEFLFEHISLPSNLTYHSWSNCGWHVTGLTTFDKHGAQNEYVIKVNDCLKNYNNDILDDSGWIINQSDHANHLIREADVILGSENIVSRAIKKFFHYSSSIDDKKESLITLAGELELLKSKKIRLNTKDESDLFNIINKFDIRHNNISQKSDYEKDIFYEWMLFTFVASINMLNKILKRK